MAGATLKKYYKCLVEIRSLDRAGDSPSTRRLVDWDLPATSRLHRRVLTLGLFPRLGPGFLRCYHQTFVDSPHAIALAGSRAGRMDGFLLGTLDHEAHGDWVRSRHQPALATQGLIALLGRPWLWGWFLRTRARTYARALASLFHAWPSVRRTPATGRQGGDAAATARTAPRRAVLVHVAVDDSQRGHGLGRALCQEFVDRARAAGCHDIRLSTVADGPATDFYDRLGWQRMGSSNHPDGVELACYGFPVVVPRNG